MAARKQKPKRDARKFRRFQDRKQINKDYAIGKKMTNYRVSIADDRMLFFQIMGPDDDEDVAFLRTMDGIRRYGWPPNNLHYWECHATHANLSLIKQNRPGWQIDELVELEYGQPVRPKVVETMEKADNIEGKQLYPYQREGVEFIEKLDGHALLADPMGLGKTVQALAWLKLRPEVRPAIVVCPASLKLNWARECIEWTGEHPHILYGRDASASRLTDASIFIINFDIIQYWVAPLRELQPEVLVIDECQLIRNSKAKRTKAVKQLMKWVPRMLAMSGTPIVNRPIEFFNVLNILDPITYSHYFTYAREYCGAKRNRFGWQMDGATKVKELHDDVFGRIAIRREKATVLPQLPKKRRSIVPLEIDNRDEYEMAQDDVINWITDNRGNEAAMNAERIKALALINTLKILAAEGKMKQAENWIATFLSSGEKLVVFAIHHSVVDLVMSKFKKVAVKIDGRDSHKARDEAVQSFQNDDNTRLLVGNIQAAGVGLTLTAASNTAFLEMGWSPGEHEQAEDRVHRIGQTAESVTAYYLIADDTIEVKIANIISKKQDILSQVLEGREAEQESLISTLIKQIQNERR